MKYFKVIMLLFVSGFLASCDIREMVGPNVRLSIEDSRAVGAACRHSGRALEDCFTLNPNAHQSGVFEGWRDMNDYMMTNNIETVKPKMVNGQEAKQEQENSIDSVTGLPETAAGRPKFDPSILGRRADQTKEEKQLVEESN